MRQYGKPVKGAAVILAVIMALSGCGEIVPENMIPNISERFNGIAGEVEGTDTDGVSEDISDDESGSEGAAETIQEATALEWKDPMVELGETFEFSEDVRDYIQAAEEEYKDFALTNNLDLSCPGQYSITVTGMGQTFEFPVTVQDTTFPEMTVINGCIPLMPGETLQNSVIIRYYADNDTVCEFGFFDLHRIGELADFEEGKLWESTLDYRQEALSEDTELLQELQIPEEEGVYEATAAVRDRSGNAATIVLTILADKTAPEISVPRQKVTLTNGGVFYPIDGVYCTDNFYAPEDCTLSMDVDEYNKLAAAFQNSQPGTYNLTYIARDMSGNVGSKTITVTLSAGGGNGNNGNNGNSSQGSGNGNNGDSSQGSGNGDNGNSSQGSGNGNNGDSSQGSGNGNSGSSSDQFMDDMAKAAFDKVNQYRSEAGLGAMAWDDTIYNATKVRAQEIVALFSHSRPDGSSCFTSLDEAGVSYMTAGENIAMGYNSADAVTTGWYNSEGHKQNMLNGEFGHGAIACLYQGGSYYWVNLFTD